MISVPDDQHSCAMPEVTAVDQRLKILAVILGSGLMASMQSATSLLWALATCGLLGVMACLTAGKIFGLAESSWVLRRWLRINLLTLMIWLSVPWTFVAGSGWQWQMEGAEQALLITLRLNAIYLWCAFWLAEVEATALARGLRALGLPARLAFLLYLTARTLQVLGTTNQRIARAGRARAGASAAGWRQLEWSAQRVQVLLIEALRRAELLTVALRARGIDLQTGGSVLAVDASSAVPRRDWLLVPATLLLLLAGIWRA